MREKLDWRQIVRIGGAVIAFSIGAGFATGQEVMQFFASNGYLCILTAVTFFLIMVYTNCSFAWAGNHEKFSDNSAIFRYYCGPVLGRIFDYFTILVCYSGFIVMVGGASSTLSQQFGVPYLVGGMAVALLSGLTVVFGLNSLVDVISKIGPVLIVFTMAIAIITIAQTGGNIPEGVAALESGQVEVLRGGSNAVTSAFIYAGSALLWFPSFLSNLGARNRLGNVWGGIAAGQILTVLTGVLISFSILANIFDVAGSQVPSLMLADRIAPWLSVAFAFIIFAAIYSSATPLLWTAASRFTTEGTAAYRILALALMAVGCIIALFVPFDRLVNVIFGINGYGGFVFMALMIIKDVRTALKHRSVQA